MKLIWFGGQALRIFADGQIIVIDPHSAESQFRKAEIEAGANHNVDSRTTELALVQNEATLSASRASPKRLIDQMDDEQSASRASVARDEAGNIAVIESPETSLWVLTSAPRRLPVLSGSDCVVVHDRAGLDLMLREASGLAVELLIAWDGLSEDDWDEIHQRSGALTVHWLDPGLAMEL